MAKLEDLLAGIVVGKKETKNSTILPTNIVSVGENESRVMNATAVFRFAHDDSQERRNQKCRMDTSFLVELSKKKKDIGQASILPPFSLSVCK